MSHYRSVTTALAVLVLATPLAAQGVTDNRAAPNATPLMGSVLMAMPRVAIDPAPSLAPTLANATVGVRMGVTAAAPDALVVRSAGSHSPAMMIVGGVALLVGAVVGGNAGTIIMVGGGAIGLWGLWNYLQ